ncbi:TPA: hypothetical protein ACH3X2_006580 [Trebouxia sp. C0005]
MLLVLQASMPGLLQSTDSGVASFKFVAAFFAELIGVLIFTLYGSAVASTYGPWGNGITLAVLVYLTANVSGGHLNPAVTIATMVSGHHGIFAGIAYIIAQISGACLGICLLIGLLPGQSIGMGDAGMGCFKAGTGLTRGMAFGWEFVMTFLLVAVVYAVAIGKPSFTETGPLAVGFALWCSAFVAGEFTGASLNPARTLGPAFVYHCNWRYAWVYVLAELLGGITAGIVSWPLYGTAGPWARKVLRPIQNAVGPFFNKANTAVQKQIDNLPPSVSTFLDLKTTTDGENGEEGGDEEQGGGDGGQKDKKGQSHKAQPDQQRGLLKTPAGQHQQIRSRTVGQEANGHTYPEYEPQQYQTPVYAPHPQPYVNDSPNEYETYRSPEPMTRHPSINMDWQTLRVPR